MFDIKKGQKYKSTKFLKVKGLIKFGKGYEKIFEGVLPKGKIVISQHNTSQSSAYVEFKPEKYKFFERMYLSSEDKENPDYQCFVVLLSPSELEQSFKRVYFSKNGRKR